MAVDTGLDQHLLAAQGVIHFHPGFEAFDGIGRIIAPEIPGKAEQIAVVNDAGRHIRPEGVFLSGACLANGQQHAAQQ